MVRLLLDVIFNWIGVFFKKNILIEEIERIENK
jgi:hypothetical protein